MDHRDHPMSSGTPPRDETLSATGIALVLGAMAIACIAGYFLLMTLIEMGRDEDCLLAHRRNCVVPIEMPPKP